MKDYIIYLYHSYLLYRYELKKIIYTQEYCKITKQYFGSVLNLNNGVRIDISDNIRTNFLFRRQLLINMNNEFKRHETFNTTTKRVVNTTKSTNQNCFNRI